MNNTIQFYQDAPHSCSYLDDHQARNLYPDPNLVMTNALYGQLIQHGFRRSGDITYRPYCQSCNACVPVRIDVNNFHPNRSQRRCLSKNQDITLSVLPTDFNAEHFQLYCRYIADRHAGGGMENPTEESYVNFISSHWCDTKLIEFKKQDQLVAIAVTDFIADGASAFYTFFDPDLSKNSLGTFSILQQIYLTKKYNLSKLYLGYWIKNCRKMQYKQNFSSVEAYTNQQWQSLNSLKNLE